MEIDVALCDTSVAVIVEVKTRSRQDYGEPEEFVTIEQQRAYVRMADKYVVENNRTEEVRFDIIAIEKDGDDYHITHLENAFSAVGLGLYSRRSK